MPPGPCPRSRPSTYGLGSFPASSHRGIVVRGDALGRLLCQPVRFFGSGYSVVRRDLAGGYLLSLNWIRLHTSIDAIAKRWPEPSEFPPTRAMAAVDSTKMVYVGAPSSLTLAQDPQGPINRVDLRVENLFNLFEPPDEEVCFSPRPHRQLAARVFCVLSHRCSPVSTYPGGS